MTSILENTQKLLRVKRVVLRNSFVNINDEIEAGELATIASTAQNFRGVARVKETKFENDKSEWWEYSFYYSVGIRLIAEDDNDVVPLVEIKALFSAIYISDTNLSEEQIEVFSKNNVGYHVWPYWREFMQSSCMRLSIDPIDAPLYFCPPPNE